MDGRQQITAYHLYYEEAKRNRLERLMDTAEAVRMGSASVQSKKNADIYFKWIRRLQRVINPEKQKKPNLWDMKLKGKRKSFTIN